MKMQSIEKTTGFFKSFDGTQVYYEVRGEGPPLVFCYGIACLFNHWNHQLKYFSKNYQTIVFDYRGHHRTPVPEDKNHLSVEAISKDLVALFDHLSLKKATVLTHSFGSQILLKAYKTNPELFEKIVMINGIFRNPFALIAESSDIVKGVVGLKKLYKQSPELFNTVWENGIQNPLAIPISGLLGGFNLSQAAQKDIEIYARGVAGMDVRVFLTLFEDMIVFDELSMLSSITAPTLILAGSKDAVTPLEEQKIFEQEIPGSELQVIPYGSHCAQLDFPEIVNAKIESFIKG